MPDGSHAQPEFYPRPDRTLYVCGASMSDKTPLPEYAADVVHSDAGVERLKERVRTVIRKEWTNEALESDNFVRQACYRPDSDKTHLPVIGKIGNGCVSKASFVHTPCIFYLPCFIHRLWVASGHQVWGILLGKSLPIIMFLFLPKLQVL